MANQIDNCQQHYDTLIDENNDPVWDSAILKAYMDKWDGDVFMEMLQLSPEKNVLEIGIGTGRLAIRIASECKNLTGIDCSPKTIQRAGQNLSAFENVTLVCGDFMTYGFTQKFDVIYSSLTFMHIEDKQAAISKAASLLMPKGRFVLSIDKSQEEFLNCNNRQISIFPDTPDNIIACAEKAGLQIAQISETEFAYLIEMQPNADL